MQFKKEWVIPTSIGVASLGSGIAIGFAFASAKFIGNVRKSTEVTESLEEAVNIARKQILMTDELLKQTEDLYKKVKEEVQLKLDLEHHEEDDEVIIIEHDSKFSAKNEALKEAVMADADEEDESMVNVFRNTVDEDWDWDVEMTNRRPDRPYIIHRDEYFNEEKDDECFTQSTITYYAGDRILCDESDVPIYEQEQIVGKLEFGRGSGDPNVCYVRNERLTSEYEVVREPGWFGKEVLGSHVQHLIEQSKNAKIEHSVPKFRPE